MAAPVPIAAAATGAGTANPGMLQRLRSFLPEGRELPEAEWRQRHRVILYIIYAHAVGLAAFGIYQRWDPVLAVGEGFLIALLGVLAWTPALGRRFRSSVAALALVTSSAVLVQFSAQYNSVLGTTTGGYIEAHFHYFVIVAVVALYQDWAPFLMAILYVAVDHGVIGTLFPAWVYNHADGIAHPWKWALIHAVFVLSECAALITVWRTSEQARARSDLVLKSTGEGILGVGLDGCVMFANPAAVGMTGQSEQVLVGKPVGQLFSSWPLLSIHAGRVAGIATEAALLRPAGDPTPVEVVATPIMQNGQAQGSVLAFKDISERKQAEADHANRIVQESEIKRLQEEANFKTLFINTAAHELRTPLTPLKLQLHVLRGEKRGELNEEQRRITGILGRNLDRLGQLVEDVLDVGRLQAGRIRLETAPVGIDRVVLEVVEAFQELAQKNGVELKCRIQGPLTADADSRRISQILFNLVDNALKFTPAGGRVDVEAEARQGIVHVQVRDTGVGLSAEDQTKLFQPFSQAHDPMEKTRSGSGLGLYISRGLAELHGGTLRCESAGQGRGSTFTLVLPIVAPVVRLAVPEASGGA